MNLNCVNNWCKYKNTLYCQENCGSFCREDTILKDIFPILKNKKSIVISDFINNSLLLFGEPCDILNKTKDYENKTIKELHYDESGKTFCIWIS